MATATAATESSAMTATLKPLQQQQQKQKQQPGHALLRSLIGGVSCAVASVITNPLDVAKVRLQGQITATILLTPPRSAAASHAAPLPPPPPLYNGLIRGMQTIVQQEGLRGLFKGVTPSILRELTYGSIRLGLYEPLRNEFAAQLGSQTLAMFTAGIVSGSIASVVSTPTDVVKTQMQSHAAAAAAKQAASAAAAAATKPTVLPTVLPTVGTAITTATAPTHIHVVPIATAHPAAAAAAAGGVLPVYTQQPAVHTETAVRARATAAAAGALPTVTRTPYKHTLDAFVRIAQEEGIAGLWRGVGPNVIRAAIVSSSQIGTYDLVKNELLRKQLGMPEGLTLHFAASLVAGLVTTTASTPADCVKTRVMQDREGKYQGSMDCFRKTLQQEGPRAFMKGWVPAWLRLGPHTVITFMLIERLRFWCGLNSL
ncbi:uncoupling protein 2 [Capsaspora owczarzaki ATCC 30864]|uniref:Uncoupling protein 2 n=1 Tax=Capsaspora owczarzaki (strain ATCC 30864) TaxID=595528 RepID=A0A0D2WL28_CAPO3|nr:uncoupling protein 2 [Capsaspora owczarzaki ATCC 30864]KJE90473.1 uncoupling protein 2 [Capsaspora owczarzaki ATCC 30864]|eukprot:XP_004364651.2 uncoupling protein 2 [Capsaspora owczarzaki ATCC 30864]